MRVCVYSDASVRRHQRGYAWIAVAGGRVVGQGSGPISRRLCPQDSSTHAEAIALALAEQATRQFADRQFFTDSESLG